MASKYETYFSYHLLAVGLWSEDATIFSLLHNPTPRLFEYVNSFDQLINVITEYEITWLDSFHDVNGRSGLSYVVKEPYYDDIILMISRKKYNITYNICID